MFLKKLFSDSLIYAVGPQIPKIASIFVLPIITRYLTPTDYGIAGVVSAYAGLLSALGDLGFSIVMVNAFYNYPKKWPIYWRQFHFYLSVWSIIYGFLLTAVLYFIVPQEARKNTWNIIACLVIPVMFFNTTITMASRYYQFARKPLFIAIVSAGVGSLSIFLYLYTIAYLKMAYMGWYITMFICSFITFFCYFYPVYFKYKLIPIFQFRKRFLYHHLKISLPVIPHNYSVYLLNSSDRLVMERLGVKTGDIGGYNLAYTFGGYMEFVGNAIGMAVGPLYTKLYAAKNFEADRAVKFITHWLQVSFIIGSFLVALWCKEVFDVLISNNELKLVYPLAIIIIMGYAYRPYYWASINRLQYHEKTSELWKISFIAGVLNVILNIIFIPIYGVIAAAVTTLFSLLYIGYSGHFLKSFRQIETQKYYPIAFIITILISTITVFLLKDATILQKGIITLTLMGLYTIYIFRIKDDFSRIPS